MLENLRKILDNDNREEEVQSMMLESMDSLEDMFIEEDGEADIPEDEIESILNKIPAYDEEQDLNKKLSKIAESYIPEDL